jgi:uncharacterized protein
MILRSLMLLALIAAHTAPAPSPPPPQRDPRNWPEPVIDKIAPALPRLRPGAVLIFSKTNGYRDPEQIDTAKPVLAALVRKQGRDAFETENAAVMNPRDLARFSTVVFNNTSGNIFDEGQRAAFRAWVERGGGVVLLHGAGGDAHYDWRWWPEVLIGAQYIGHTRRPKQFQEAMVEILDRSHAATRKLPGKWVRTDEWYAFDRVPSGHGTRILATLDEASYDASPASARMGKPHPIVWTRCIGRGRVIFSGLGHKAESYVEPLHRELIGGAIRWASRREGMGCR